MRISVHFFLKPWPWTLLSSHFVTPVAFQPGVRVRLSKMLVALVSVQIVTHLPLFSPFKCVIPCTTIAALWFATINVQLQSMLSLSLCLSVSLSALALTVCLSVSLLSPCLVCVSSVSGPSCQCPAIVCLRAAHLGSHHSYGGGQRCLCRSVPHQSDCSQLRQSPSVLLPLYWPKLTAGGQVRATARAWVQWVRYNKNKTHFNPIRSLASHLQQSQKPVNNLQLSLTHSGLSPSLSIHVILLSCFTSPHPPPPTPHPHTPTPSS